jgi:hypothetical protein
VIIALMALKFCATSPEDLGTVRDLLGTVFGGGGSGDQSSLLNEPMLHWKYWKDRPGWSGSRSYALRRDRAVEAHTASLPFTLCGGSTNLSAQHFIDWASAPDSLSGGAKVLRRLLGLAEVTLAIGGSQDTRRLLPLLKFERVGVVATYARPIRPWLQTRTHQYRNWKLPARLARNSGWAISAPVRKPQTWDFRPVSPTAVPDAVWSAAGVPGTLWRLREARIAAYFLACPSIEFQLYLALKDGSPQGGFLLSFAPGVARIADLWVVEPSTDRLEAMYRLALVAAYSTGHAAEVVSYASIDSRADALGRCGFRALIESDLMAYSATGCPTEAIDCQMIDNDAAFLYDLAPEYLT